MGWWRGAQMLMMQAALGAAGYMVAGSWGALAGVVLAAWLSWLWDGVQLARLQRWLRSGAFAHPAGLHGTSARLSSAVRRALRTREHAVQQAEQRVQGVLAALQASPNGLALLDGQGHIEWCNQMAERHLGLDAQRDVGQLVVNLVRDPAFSSYWAARDFSHSTFMAGREHALSHPVALSVNIYPYGDGKHLLLSRDITTLEQADAMRRDFVANVSHEIRTPLTVLIGFIETLQTLPLQDRERQHYLALMGQQAGRMQSLVQDLLTLSRLEGSPLPGFQEWVPIAQLLRQCEVEAQALSKMLTQSSGRMHVLSFPDAQAVGMDWALAGVQAELMSAFSNLISNALRYTPAGGSVQVQWVVLPDGGARLSVQDSGPGIDAAHIGRLTERFYRVDRSRSRDTGGTGLGLAIVKHALQRHGARLEIESQLGQGATFSAVFPAQRLRNAQGPMAAPASLPLH